MERASEEFMAWVESTQDEIADRHFFATLAGVSFLNDDGSDRQQILAQCAPREWLTLEPEPTNPFDKKAIGVLSPYGQIGYLDRRCAQEISNAVKNGRRFRAAFCEMREASHRNGTHVYGGVIVIFELNAQARENVLAQEKAERAAAVSGMQR